MKKNLNISSIFDKRPFPSLPCPSLTQLFCAVLILQIQHDLSALIVLVDWLHPQSGHKTVWHRVVLQNTLKVEILPLLVQLNIIPIDGEDNLNLFLVDDRFR